MEDGQGEPLRRFKGEKLPCHFTPSACPKGSPTAGIELSDTNWRVYNHYLECRATGTFPDDDVVRRNAAAIYEIEQSIRDEQQWKFLAALISAKS